MKLSPIVLFAYNRPNHLQATLDALKNNHLAKNSILYIFADGAKNEAEISKVTAVHAVIQNITGFKKVNVHYHKKNLGLAKSVITGVTKVFEKHKTVIVLEDDIVTNQYFLKYMNAALEFYSNESSIFSVTGYSHPKTLLDIPAQYDSNIYFLLRASSWSWATWKNRWETIKWDTKSILSEDRIKVKLDRAGEDLYRMLKLQERSIIDSWAVRFCATAASTNRYTVYPRISYVDNIGMDGSGRHSKSTMIYKNNIVSRGLHEISFSKNIIVDPIIEENFLKIYKTPFLHKLYEYIKDIFIPT